MLHPDVATVTRFHQAFMENDGEALAGLLAEDARWYIAGKSVLAGEHAGRNAIVGLVSRMHELTGGTLRPFREDSHDVIASPHHIVLANRFLAERGGKQLDSHEAIFVHTKDGKITSLLHYFYDQYAFDEFWD
jgi:ketosteroid isomerase-like protein